MKPTNAYQAYRKDPEFRQVVDQLGALLEHARLTPMEIRQAAMMACIRHDLRRWSYDQVYVEGELHTMSNESVNRLADFYKHYPLTKPEYHNEPISTGDQGVEGE